MTPATAALTARPVLERTRLGLLHNDRCASTRLLGDRLRLAGVLGFLDALVQRQRLPYHLIHVVVLVGAEAADKGHVRRFVRQLLIALVQLGVLRPRDRVVGIALGGGYS